MTAQSKKPVIFSLKEKMLQLYYARKAINHSIISILLIIIFFVLSKLLSSELLAQIDQNGDEVALYKFYILVSSSCAYLTGGYLVWQLKVLFFESSHVLWLRDNDVSNIHHCNCEKPHRLIFAKYSIRTDVHTRAMLHIRCRQCNTLLYKCNSATT